MSVRDLIDAIASGDTIATQTAFESEMLSRIGTRIEERRQQVAQSMFQTVEEQADMEDDEEEDGIEEAAAPKAPGSPKPNEVHVQHVGGGKYKVHAVGKNFADGIKSGEHLSDTDLDDFHEMGGKIKHVK